MLTVFKLLLLWALLVMVMIVLVVVTGFFHGEAGQVGGKGVEVWVRRV